MLIGNVYIGFYCILSRRRRSPRSWWRSRHHERHLNMVIPSLRCCPVLRAFGARSPPQRPCKCPLRPLVYLHSLSASPPCSLSVSVPLLEPIPLHSGILPRPRHWAFCGCQGPPSPVRAVLSSPRSMYSLLPTRNPLFKPFLTVGDSPAPSSIFERARDRAFCGP